MSYAFVCHHPSMSLNKEKVSREISENKIAVCEKTQGLRSGNFSDLNSACSTVLVPVKIFQFQDMDYENRFLGTFQGHSKRPRSTERDLFGFELSVFDSVSSRKNISVPRHALRKSFSRHFSRPQQTA